MVPVIVYQPTLCATPQYFLITNSMEEHGLLTTQGVEMVCDVRKFYYEYTHWSVHARMHDFQY